jgi:hypothetical protein
MLLWPRPFRPWLLLSLLALFMFRHSFGFPYANWNVPDSDQSSNHYQLAILGPRTQSFQQFAQYMVMSTQSSRVVGFVREDLHHPACSAFPPQSIDVLRSSHGFLFWIDSIDIPAGVDAISAYVNSFCTCVGISNHSMLMYDPVSFHNPFNQNCRSKC